MSSIQAWLRWSGALPLLAAVLCFVVTLDGTFIYDDVDLLLEDPRLTDPSRWRELFTGSYNGGEDNLYRPLVSLSFLVQHRLHGPNPFAYHLVNLLLHAGAAWSVTLLARRLASASGVAAPRRLAVIAGVLFAVHPAHVEAVAMIVGRAEMMTTIAICLALRSLVPAPTQRGTVLAVGLFVLALLCKENALVFPLLVGAWSVVARRCGLLSNDVERRRLSLVFASSSLLLFGYVVVRQSFLKFDWDRSFLDWTIQPMVRASPLDRWTLPLELLGRYLALLSAPLRLSIDHGYAVILPRTQWQTIYPWLGMLGAIGIGAWIVIGWRRREALLLLSGVALVLSLAIPLNLVAIIGTVFGERLIYLPSAFVILALAWTLTKALKGVLTGAPTGMTVAPTGMTAALTGTTGAPTGETGVPMGTAADPAAMTAAPTGMTAALMGAVAKRRGRTLATAVLIALGVLWSLRSVTYAARFEDRLSFYERSLREQPRSVRLHVLAAHEQLRRGNDDRAERLLHDGLSLAPQYDELYVRLAEVAWTRGDFALARRHLDAAMSVQPRVKTALLYGFIDRLEQGARR